jgi:hypothetical protein
MPSTTVHLPDDLLSRIDRFVSEEGISRNKFIIEACKQALETNAGKWPGDFFDSNLSDANRRLLRKGVDEMETAIARNRKNRNGDLI